MNEELYIVLYVLFVLCAAAIGYLVFTWAVYAAYHLYRRCCQWRRQAVEEDEDYLRFSTTTCDAVEVGACA